ncbi:MAG TPA: zinc ribbon domain-containing protein [Chloroflexia bacterium]|nr:zinc ribbon domain-containing protein [Chloroflexia bacterium]
MTASCPYCGKPNQQGTTFCIHCGRPTDEESVQELASDDLRPSTSTSLTTSNDTRPATRFTWRDLLTPERGLEFLLGAIILLAIVGFAFYNSAQQAAKAAHYRAGLDADGKQEYERAVVEFEAAGDYWDAPKRIEGLQEKIATRKAMYDKGAEAAGKGKWWLAASRLRQVNDIHSNYADAVDLLAQARSINGAIVYRLARSADGDGGVYVAQADGGETHRIPNTNALSMVHARSPDGRWLCYSFYSNAGRSLMLYDIEHTTAYELAAELIPGVISARFTSGNQTLVVDADDLVTIYSVPPSDAPGQPQALTIDLANPIIPEIQGDTSLLVERETGNNRSIVSITKSSMGGPSNNILGTMTQQIAIEEGAIDGAIFSRDMRYLLYRTCTSPNEEKDFTCALRLVDFTSESPSPSTIATIPVSAREWNRWALRGEFTMDGRHLLVTLRYGTEEDVHLYSLQTGDMERIQTIVQGEPQGTHMNSGPLVAYSMQGLKFWEGPNSLTYTRRNVMLFAGENVWAQRFFARSHWVMVAPNNLYAVYLVGNDINVSYGNYAIFAVPLSARPEGSRRPVPLLHSTRRPGEWLPNIYLLPDGQTLMAVDGPRAGMPRGLYARDMETGQSTLVVPDATEMWVPGFTTLHPEMLAYASSRCDDC